MFTSLILFKCWLYSVAAADDADLPGLVNNDVTPAALSKLFWRDPLPAFEAEFLLDTALTGFGAGVVVLSQLGLIWSIYVECW